MGPEQVDRLIELVVTIGGQMASDGFSIAMRRVTYLAYKQFFWALFAGMTCLGFVCASQACWKRHREDKETAGYDDEWLMGAWVLRVCAAIILLIVVSALQQGLDMMLNSEWHAVQMLMELL